jgi:hypothetical protein
MSTVLCMCTPMYVCMFSCVVVYETSRILCLQTGTTFTELMVETLLQVHCNFHPGCTFTGTPRDMAEMKWDDRRTDTFTMKSKHSLKDVAQQCDFLIVRETRGTWY